MADRPQLLSHEPRDKHIDMAELVGIANAIEVEAVARYEQLAQIMERRGESDTAAAFREMCEIEKRHVDFVGHWANALGQEIGPAQSFAWRLPDEIGVSWEEARLSSLLTAYRALAIAVTNEERAFAFYAYIAANAVDPAVKREAEQMAQEELAHAAELRVRRRLAFRREHPAGAGPARPAIETVDDFRSLEQQLERDAAGVHGRIARALADSGDTESAALLDAMARHEAGLSGSASKRAEPAPSGGEGLEGMAPLALLRNALRPLERASETYEDLVAHAPDEQLLSAGQAALRGVVERISSLSARIGRLEGRP